MKSDLIQKTDELRQYAFNLGFDDFGVAKADLDTPYSDQFTEAIAQGLHGPLDYMERTKDERANVRLLVPNAKSVVMLVKNYYTGDHSDFVDMNALSSAGRVSRYAWGGDYHHWFKKRLRKMRGFLLQNAPSARIHIFNDTGPVLERGWAERAGLGFIGKSAMFIHRRFGTFVFLGGLVTDLELQPSEGQPMPSCGTCARCQEGCPSKAIIRPKVVDAKLCATTWNVERPLDPQASAFKQGSHWVVGCDICQEVCPFNKFKTRTAEERFQPRDNHITLKSVPETDLSGTPLARAGRKGISQTLSRLGILE